MRASDCGCDREQMMRGQKPETRCGCSPPASPNKSYAVGHCWRMAVPPRDALFAQQFRHGPLLAFCHIGPKIPS